jgi:hypothetical protein
MSVHPQTQHPSIAVKRGHCYTKNFAIEGGDESVQDRKMENDTRMEESEYLLDDDKESECLLNDDNVALICVRRKLKQGCLFLCIVYGQLL